MSDIIDEPERSLNYHYKFKRIPVIIYTIIFALTVLMRITHIPGGVFFGVFAIGTILSYSIFSFVILKGSDLLNNIYFGISILGILFLFWGALFNDGLPYNLEGLLVILGFCIILIIPQIIALQISKSFSKRK